MATLEKKGFLQSQPKRNYLNDVIQYYWNKDKKVIIIFDEIHEGVQNFTSKLYPNLLTLRNAVHKILVLSATYTEPAIVVLKLLASLTGNRIKVVESKRLKVGKQASLSLVFIREEYTSTDIEPLNILNSNIQDFLNKGLRVNILSYSKTLAANLEGKDSKIAAMFYR